MADLSGLSSVSGASLTETQIRGILAQIDLDITNLLRDGKLSALKYAIPGAADRAGNLRALLEARSYYQTLLTSRPSWEVSVGE
ncbi:hypothetical protein CA54_07970 [Symmachiella macrocystis]|uniref:Uncharacterized protein n=1 Tax=Symmachiella macrocystis TaxID=2527985 RepID=A0A5C6BKD8_9PLAN|nr:hypothetical protein [Symmachiella macrocystis]TWU11981.1 hypothetical protein CA54_07970 [Symmachiella macrocystis]